MKKLFFLVSIVLVSLLATAQTPQNITVKSLKFNPKPAYSPYPDDSSVLFINRITGKVFRTHISVGNNIYNANGTITSSRTIFAAGHILFIDSTSYYRVFSNTSGLINGTYFRSYSYITPASTRMSTDNVGGLSFGHTVGTSIYGSHLFTYVNGTNKKFYAETDTNSASISYKDLLDAKIREVRVDATGSYMTNLPTGNGVYDIRVGSDGRLFKKDTATGGGGSDGNNFPTALAYNQSARQLDLSRNGLANINVVLPVATPSLPGLMDSTDKKKLDSFSTASFYFKVGKRSGYDSLAYTKGDSLYASRSLKITVADPLQISVGSDGDTDSSLHRHISLRQTFLDSIRGGLFGGGGGGCGADIEVIFNSGGNYTFDVNENVYKSTDGVNHFCVHNAGYLPFGEAGRYYSRVGDIGTDSTKGTVMALKQGGDFTNCTELDGWNSSIRYAVEPLTGSTFYRVYDGIIDDFTVTAVTYQTGDLFGFAITDAGVVTAVYYRGGTWNTMHTFPNNATGNLYPGANGFEWSHLVDPKVSCNFQLL